MTLSCPAGTQPRSGDCGEPSVRVSTTAVDPENDVLTYNYTVSGGRIVGQGANVTWDLSGVRPGTYTITAGVDDGCGVCGKTETKTIEVRECDCVTTTPPCSCATLSVTGPSATIKSGEQVTFTANVSRSAENITYNWTVSAGTIESGQGTPSITVSTTGLQSTNITATVDIGSSEFCFECPRTASETVSILNLPTGTLRGNIKRINSTQVLPNVRVELYIGQVFQTFINTDANGNYDFGSIDSGKNYTIKVSRDGFFPDTATRFLQPDANLQVNFALRRKPGR